MSKDSGHFRSNAETPNQHAGAALKIRGDIRDHGHGRHCRRHGCRGGDAADGAGAAVDAGDGAGRHSPMGGPGTFRVSGPLWRSLAADHAWGRGIRSGSRAS
jgi:hypothetical protein